MPIYKYTAKNQIGKILSGQAKVQSQTILTDLLMERGLVAVDIKEKNAITDISEIGIFKPKVKIKDLAVFCRQFAIILEAGVPIAQALDVLREQTTNSTFKECLTDLYENIQKGLSLSTGMKHHTKIFPGILINMIDAGEVSGQLDRVFIRMADHFEKEFKLNQKIKSAMTYPIIICVVATLVISVLMIYVVPTFAGVLTGMGSDLPGFTKVLISISMFFKNFWWLIIILIISLVVGIKAFSNSNNGKRFFGKLVLRLPVLKGVMRTIITARFTRTLGTLVASGVLLIQALEIVQKVLGNIIIAERMDVMLEEIKKGKGLSQPLADMHYFQPMVLSMIRIGEESGNIDFALDKCADFYDQEVDTVLKQLTELLEPIIMIAMGFVVGFIILSILYPMISVYQNMAK